MQKYDSGPVLAKIGMDDNPNSGYHGNNDSLHKKRIGDISKDMGVGIADIEQRIRDNYALMDRMSFGGKPLSQRMKVSAISERIGIDEKDISSALLGWHRFTGKLGLYDKQKLAEDYESGMLVRDMVGQSEERYGQRVSKSHIYNVLHEIENQGVAISWRGKGNNTNYQNNTNTNSTDHGIDEITPEKLAQEAGARRRGGKFLTALMALSIAGCTSGSAPRNVYTDGLAVGDSVGMMVRTDTYSEARDIMRAMRDGRVDGAFARAEEQERLNLARGSSDVPLVITTDKPRNDYGNKTLAEIGSEKEAMKVIADFEEEEGRLPNIYELAQRGHYSIDMRIDRSGIEDSMPASNDKTTDAIKVELVEVKSTYVEPEVQTGPEVRIDYEGKMTEAGSIETNTPVPPVQDNNLESMVGTTDVKDNVANIEDTVSVKDVKVSEPVSTVEVDLSNISLGESTYGRWASTNAPTEALGAKIGTIDYSSDVELSVHRGESGQLYAESNGQYLRLVEENKKPTPLEVEALQRVRAEYATEVATPQDISQRVSVERPADTMRIWDKYEKDTVHITQGELDSLVEFIGTMKAKDVYSKSLNRHWGASSSEESVYHLPLFRENELKKGNISIVKALKLYGDKHEGEDMSDEVLGRSTKINANIEARVNNFQPDFNDPAGTLENFADRFGDMSNYKTWDTKTIWFGPVPWKKYQDPVSKTFFDEAPAKRIAGAYKFIEGIADKVADDVEAGKVSLTREQLADLDGFMHTKTILTHFGLSGLDALLGTERYGNLIDDPTAGVAYPGEVTMGKVWDRGWSDRRRTVDKGEIKEFVENGPARVLGGVAAVPSAGGAGINDLMRGAHAEMEEVPIVNIFTGLGHLITNTGSNAVQALSNAPADIVQAPFIEHNLEHKLVELSDEHGQSIASPKAWWLQEAGGIARTVGLIYMINGLNGSGGDGGNGPISTSGGGSGGGGPGGGAGSGLGGSGAGGTGGLSP